MIVYVRLKVNLQLAYKVKQHTGIAVRKFPKMASQLFNILFAQASKTNSYSITEDNT